MYFRRGWGLEFGSLERFLKYQIAVSKYLQDFEVSFSRSKFSNPQDLSGSEIILKKHLPKKKVGFKHTCYHYFGRKMHKLPNFWRVVGTKSSPPTRWAPRRSLQSYKWRYKPYNPYIIVIIRVVIIIIIMIIDCLTNGSLGLSPL